jgi:hypothetical protein
VVLARAFLAPGEQTLVFSRAQEVIQSKFEDGLTEDTNGV